MNLVTRSVCTRPAKSLSLLDIIQGEQFVDVHEVLRAVRANLSMPRIAATDSFFRPIKKADSISLTEFRSVLRFGRN